MRRGWRFAVVAIGLSGFVAGCSSDAGVGVTGSLQMPLLATSRSGEMYRLTGTFHIEGPATRDLSADGDAVQATLPVGSYSVRLDDGWVLSHLLPGGGSERVSATLLGSNPIPFTIAEDVTVVVSFKFKVGSMVIDMATGDVNITIDVDDGLIDDLEDGDDAIVRIGGRDGVWFSFNDGTGTQVPAPGTPALPELQAGPQGHVMHTTGSGFSSWGAGIGFDPRIDLSAYNASSFAGVRFTYRSARATRFEIDTTATTPVPTGTCTGVCFDSHGIDLPASPSFRTVEVVWGQLAQRGFGTPAPFLPDQVRVMKWLFQPDAFDFAVDDIEFLSPVALQSELQGEWGGVLPFPVVPIHAHMLPTGNVLFWDTGVGSQWLFDPLGGGFAATPSPSGELFCSGHSFMADGRLLVAGGQNNGVTEEGRVTAFAYDPFANTWTQLADMNAGRWYPTNTTLGDGTVLVTSGSITAGVNNRVPQVYSPATNTWRDLTGAFRVWPLYPMMHLLPDGSVMNTGPEPGTLFVGVSDAGSLTNGPARSAPFSDYGTSVVYGEGRIIVIGGGNPPRAGAEVIDVNAGGAAWRAVAPMAHARRMHNSVILADGKVLVTGGTSGPGFNNRQGAVLAAELWDPDTETWRELASQSVARLYHSTALLLPDGRVMSAGGGHPPGENGGTDNFDAEIFSPPYLFRGPRPAIQGAPARAAWGDAVTVTTPDAGRIARVNLIRVGSVTHSTNMDQRLSRPSFETADGELHVHIPSSPNVVPPGPYLLFLVDQKGVPSVGHPLLVGAAT